MLKIEDRQLIRWLVVDAVYTDLFNHYIYGGGFLGLRSLKELDILSSQEIWRWERVITDLRFGLTRQFGGLEGWECPDFRIFAVETNLDFFRVIYLWSVAGFAGAEEAGRQVGWVKGAEIRC